ncbi:MAG: hypothetical protein JKX73_06975 [Flavobacteriales bacterium]|nr:hypothetical protein [Flavobacteriales bacterium]
MNKIILILTFPLILILGFSNNNTIAAPPIDGDEKCVEKPLTFGDLNETEKAEFIAHLLATGSCEFKGIDLYGKVQFVTSFPDIKIQYVTSFPDIKVQWVTSFPDKCGKWQEVTSFPDFKVQVVTSFPDIKVQEVTSFPGMN